MIGTVPYKVKLLHENSCSCFIRQYVIHSCNYPEGVRQVAKGCSEVSRMYKVFLVEDEMIMREGIRNNIDWQNEGFHFVGEASDGELAYPLIQKTKPDIIITDIMMPFMDGLELSRLIKKELPNTKILILSGHNEFEYAKEAIRIGVTDYLVKPISSTKLLSSVKDVAKLIEEERSQQELLEKHKRDLREGEAIAKQKLFEQIIYNRLSLSEIISKGRELGMELSAQFFNVLLFAVNSAREEKDGYSEDMVQFSEELKKLFQEGNEWCLIERGLEGWSFLIKGDTEQELQLSVQKVITKLEELMKGYANLSYFGGIGRAVNRIRELGRAFEEANRAFSYRYLSQESHFVHIDQINELKTDKKDMMHFDITMLDGMNKNALNNFLRIGHADEVAPFVTDFLFSMGTPSTNSYFFRQYVVMDTLLTTAAFMKSLGQSSEDIIEKYGDTSEITKVLDTIEASQEYVEKMIGVAIQLRDSVSLKKYEELLAKAREFIRNNYDKEDISLNSVAASVNISPSHFSMIFSQEIGVTFIEYLTNVRMEKAKELLLCTNMKSSEIAYAVGYKDPHYFSYLFKKIQKCTPTEFRTRDKGE